MKILFCEYSGSTRGLRRTRWAGIVLAFLLGAGAAGCGGEPLDRSMMVQAYERALEATASQAKADWDDDPKALDEAMERLQRYFEQLTSVRLEELTPQVYAPNAFLCDTLHIAQGIEQIETYFRQSAKRVDSLSVTFIDYSSADREVYVRWSMTIVAQDLQQGRPIKTFGMSHFRFDPEGKVILQQDFWDAAAGFFEQLPGLHRILPRIRGKLSPSA